MTATVGHVAIFGGDNGRSVPLVVVEGGSVRSRQASAATFTIAHMFAVVVVWDAAWKGWIGWLTTIHHESMCFGPADLTNPLFTVWLAHLPGWDAPRMTNAVASFGLHLVWRRPGR